MKSAAFAAILLATVLGACEKQPSKLDKMSSTGAGAEMPTGDLESRVRRLEQEFAKREEALGFLDMAYEQTMEQNTKPSPDGVYAVDIAQNLALGQYEGSPNALVT